MGPGGRGQRGMSKAARRERLNTNAPPPTTCSVPQSKPSRPDPDSAETN